MKYMRDLGARARWSALITTRRVANRWWDVAGRAAGFCMVTTWQQGQATYKPGMKHWRCYVLRSAHAGQHRNGNYRWATAGKPIYDPLPLNVLRTGPKPGVPPRWLRDRHYDIGTRARDRLALQVVFDRIRSSGRDRLARTEGLPPALSAGELGIMPFTQPVSDEDLGRIAEDARANPDRYSITVNEVRPRVACEWHAEGGYGHVWDCPACQRGGLAPRP